MGGRRGVEGERGGSTFLWGIGDSGVRIIWGRGDRQTDRKCGDRHYVSDMAEHTGANLVDLSASPIGAGTLRLGRDDDALRQPLIGLLAPPVRAADPKLALQLLDEAILRAVFVNDDGSHLLALLTVTIHRMHIEGLLSPSDHRLYLGPGGGEGIITYPSSQAGMQGSVG